MTWDPVKKETVHQFNAGYMIHYSMNKHRTHRYQVIKMFQWEFKLVTIKVYQKLVIKKECICSFIGDVL